MNIIKRWGKSLKWLFNHPPIDIISKHTEDKCVYCGGDDGGTVSHEDWIICFKCIKKAFDKTLSRRKA